MVEVAGSLQIAFTKQQNSVLFPYTDNSGEILSKVRQYLAQGNLGGTNSSMNTASFEYFENWSLPSAINRIQFIPNESWKRIALFATLLVISYYLHGECESYLSLPFLFGAPLMLFALRKTYLYVKAGTFPKVLEVTLSKQKIQPVEHTRLANGSDKDGNIEEIFSRDAIPKDELNTGKYLHFPNYIIETIPCIRALLEKPELKHPVETKRDFTSDEIKVVLPQITQIFNISEEEFRSCWTDFKATDEDADSLLSHFVVEGRLTSEAMTHLTENYQNLVDEAKNSVQPEIFRIVQESLRQNIERVGLNVDELRQSCLDTTDPDVFQENLSLFISILSSLEPIKLVAKIGASSISVELNSSLKALELSKLLLHMSIPTPTGTRNQELFDLIQVQIAEAQEASTTDLTPLRDFFSNIPLIRIFKLTELFQEKVREFEANKRMAKFKQLTGIDLKASDA